MELNYEEYKRKLKSCFIGKAVGGTLGMPFEGNTELRELTYYDPVPEEMVANDDLDLQVVCLETIKASGLPVNRRKIAQGYLDHLRGAPDEYGVMQRNLALDLYPPLSGSFDNKFTGGMGGAIRSELWACLAPGNPALAAALSREDACVDHSDDGVEAAVFLSAIESAAFVESDIQRIVETGLSFLNKDGRLFQALSYTKEALWETGDYIKAREMLLERFYVQNWTDVSINLSFILLGLLFGNGDFDKSICTAVNCGWDADCTGATIGALMGILNPDGIDPKWTKPIGEALILSTGIVGMHAADNIRDFCEEIAALEQQVEQYYHSPVKVTNVPALSFPSTQIREPLIKKSENICLPTQYQKNASLLMTNPFVVELIYPDKVAVTPGKSAVFLLEIRSVDDMERDVRTKLYLPNGYVLSQDEFTGKTPCRFSFEITAPSTEAYRRYKNILELTLESGGLIFEAKAGILTDWMWERKIGEKTETICVPEHFFLTPPGTAVYRAQFKYGMINVNGEIIEIGPPYGFTSTMLAQSDGCPVKVWLNNQLVVEHDGSEYTPAFHRSMNTRSVHIHWGWNDLKIVVENTSNQPKEFFFGLSKPTAEWINEIEWRLPHQ